MNLTELRTSITSLLDAVESNVVCVTSKEKNQVFGLVDTQHGDNVSFAAVEYSLEFSERPACTTVLPLYILETALADTHIPNDALRQQRRTTLCIKMHNHLLSVGYTLVAALSEINVDSVLIRAEYYNWDTLNGSSLNVIYSPTDWLPEDCIASTEDLYYTVAYDAGEAVYMSASEFDGTPVKQIQIEYCLESGPEGSGIDHGRKNLIGLDVQRVMGITTVEAPGGWKEIYDVMLHSRKRATITITYFRRPPSITK